MKRVGNLYKEIYDMNNLILAYKNARKGKGWYLEVKQVEANLDYYLNELQSMLINHTYKTSPYTMFYRQDGEKTRRIYKLPFFPDRICQWAILQVIEKYLIRNFTRDTYSAIPNKGIHNALSHIKDAMYKHKDDCRFCLKLDVKHYYQSINHDILMDKYKRLFKDRELLDLLSEIVESICTADENDIDFLYNFDVEQYFNSNILLPDIDCRTGIPIGNYLSQYSGNLYLSCFDHWLKEVKHVKYYFRYMDDIVIFGDSKEKLRELFSDIKVFLYTNLRLRVKQNWQIFPTYVRGIDFVGYRVFNGYTLLRKSVSKTLKSKMKKIMDKVKDGNNMNYSEWCSINSYIGWLKHCDGHRLYLKHIYPLLPYANKFYIDNIKGKGGDSMIYHGKTSSGIMPSKVEVTEDKVFISENIEATESVLESGESDIMYEYDYYEYSKDEYIEYQEERNADLERQISDTQMAVCEIYEMMGVVPEDAPKPEVE